MAILAEYHRPETLAAALELLADRTSRRLPLAGGAHLVGALETRQRRDVDGVVDLAALNLSYLQQAGASLRVGAMTTLTDLVEHPLSATLASGILPRTARFEGPLNLRNAATAGGLVALAEPDSELFAALLALNTAVVTVDRDGVESCRQLDNFDLSLPGPAGRPALITEIRLPLDPAAGGHARIARTPMDRCIVAAVVVAAADGRSAQGGPAAAEGEIATRTALCGVGPRPRLAGGPLTPKGDYKGSAAYRSTMAEVVVRRAQADAASLL
ncbi:MAG: FAD binding domain-containing protein [Caldilineaceae bacterium]|nr:FAD binding domain-containing protein [Caldilineaceae bacterium]